MNTGIWRHYKGDYYQVLGIAQHTETEEMMVVYISLDATRPGPRMRVRPLEMFTGVVVNPLNDHWELRFTYVGDEIPK
jgi:hypothetical protein